MLGSNQRRWGYLTGVRNPVTSPSPLKVPSGKGDGDGVVARLDRIVPGRGASLLAERFSGIRRGWRVGSKLPLRADGTKGQELANTVGVEQPPGGLGVALEAGVSMPEAAALARHANARVTAQVYAGLSDTGREAASAKLAEAGFGR